MKKILALLLAVLMVMSLVACTQAPADTTTTAPAADDTTAAAAADDGDDTTAAASSDDTDEVPYLGEVNVMRAEAASAGLCVGWMPDWIRSKIGVDMIGLPGDDSTVDQYLAGGELPDITMLEGTTRLEAAIEGGMIIDLETVKDKLPNVFETYYDANEGMIAYNKAVKSAGTGKLYGLARMFNGEPVPAYDVGGLFLRYDLYAEVGYPEINDYEDLYDCLVAMCEASPTGLDGNPMYAVSMFTDWDGGIHYGYGYTARNRGLWNQGMYAFDMKNGWDDTAEYLQNNIVMQLEEGSDYYNYIKMLYKLNQAGLVDPNTMTQTFDDAKNKCQNGSVAMQFDNWGTTYDISYQNEGIGFRRVSVGEYLAVNEMGVAYNSDTQLTISSNCSNLDAACALVNLMYDPAFTISYMNGPQGQVWDYDENGDPEFLPGGYETMMGLNFSERGCIMMLTYHFSGQMPGCSAGVTSDYSTWPCFQEMIADGTIVETKLISDWKENSTGGEHLFTNVFKNEGKLILNPSCSSFTVTTDEEMAMKRINERIIDGNWNCIFAADDATFDAEWASMYNDAIAMGYEEVVGWHSEYVINAYADFAQYVQ